MKHMPLILLACGLTALALGSTNLLAAQAGAPADATTKPSTDPAAKPTPVPTALTAAQEEELLGFLKKMGAEQYNRLVQLKAANPSWYQSSVRYWYEWMQGIKRSPEPLWQPYVDLQEAYTKISQLVNDYRVAADENQRKALVNQLHVAVARLYDIQMEIRAFKLKQLQDQLQQLEAEQQQNLRNRDRKIEESLQRWLSTATMPAPGQTSIGATSQPAE